MSFFWIKFAKKRGDLAFALADLPLFEDRQKLYRAERSGGVEAFKKALRETVPSWDCEGPHEMPIPSGWAQFAPSGEAFLSKEMFDLLKEFAPNISWQDIPSLTNEKTDKKWGQVSGFPVLDVLDMEKSAISRSASLWKPVLKNADNLGLDIFHPQGTYALFASEKVKKAMSKSGLTGFSFEKLI